MKSKSPSVPTNTRIFNSKLELARTSTPVIEMFEICGSKNSSQQKSKHFEHHEEVSVWCRKRTRIALARTVLASWPVKLFCSFSANRFSSCVKNCDWAICDLSTPSTVACKKSQLLDLLFLHINAFYLFDLGERNKLTGFNGSTQKHIWF